MAEMSPVELLRAAAEVALSKPPWLISALAEPLATVLERDANLIQIKGWDHPPDVRDELVREYAETFYAASLRVARVLLGVPDGR